MLTSLFQVHTVMCSVSHSGTLTTAAQCIQNNIVDILMTYTQPALDMAQHTEEGYTMLCLKKFWGRVFICVKDAILNIFIWIYW